MTAESAHFAAACPTCGHQIIAVIDGEAVCEGCFTNDPPTAAQQFSAEVAANPTEPLATALDRAMTAIDDLIYDGVPPDPRHLVTTTHNRIECVAYCTGQEPHIAEYRALDVKGG